jgi:hypothetical protein
VWIPAGLAHSTTLKRVRTVSVFFDPAMVRGADDRARILAAAPVIREMIVYGVRWPIHRPASDPVADAFSRRWRSSRSTGSITRRRSACRRAPIL